MPVTLDSSVYRGPVGVILHCSSISTRGNQTNSINDNKMSAYLEIECFKMIFWLIKNTSSPLPSQKKTHTARITATRVAFSLFLARWWHSMEIQSHSINAKIYWQKQKNSASTLQSPAKSTIYLWKGELSYCFLAMFLKGGQTRKYCF
jgi:hypothetical protein